MKNVQTSSSANLQWVWLALIISTGFFLRAAAIAAFSHIPESDELAYKSMALNLLSGRGIIDNMGNYAMYNVGYPLFVLAPAFSMFGEDILFAKVFNLLLGGISIALCYFVAKEAGAGKLGRLLAAAIWAIYLPASVYAVYLLKENLMVPLVLGLMWCALRLLKTPSAIVAISCGALFGLLALTGNAALSLVGVVVVALIITPASTRQRAIFSAITVVVALMVSAPWLMRNLEVIGAPVLNTNGGFNLYLGNNPAATGMFVSIADTPRGPTWQKLRESGEVQASETLKKEALSWIKEHPAEFMNLAFKKAAFFWMPPFHQGQGEASSAEFLVRALWAIQFLVIVAAAIGSFAFQRLRSRQLLILWLSIACYTAPHLLFYVIFRYREPIMPMLCVIAALAIESLIAKKALSNN